MSEKPVKLCFPEAVLDQHLIMLGKTGAGKSSALRHVVEHLLGKGKRVCTLDPKGDWWGVKSSADGKGPGLPVIMFGDFKEPKAQDVPINDRSGKHIAELVATGNRPCVIGMRGWTHGAMTRFWIDFAGSLFNLNAGELYLVVDEFHNFAPKGKILSPEAGLALHWSNRLLSEGRGLGIVCLNASQRPQKVHNDSLTSHETLVAMRVIHKADRDAIKDWIDGAGDPDKGREVLGTLAGMPRGEAYVWSPEIGFGPKRVAFPMFTTFDSFAPPQLQKKVSNAGWADVDLDTVKEKLAAVIEEAKANDPAALRKELAAARAELAKLKATPAPAGKVQTKTVERPVITDRQVERLEALHEKVGARASAFWERLSGVANPLMELLNGEQAQVGRLLTAARAVRDVPVVVAPGVVRVAPAAPARQAVAITTPRTPREPGTESPLGNTGKRRLLIALAQNPDGLTDTKLSILTGISKSGGTWRTYMAELRGNGWIEGDRGRFVATDEGLAVVGKFEPLPTGAKLLDYWRGKLGNTGKRAMFDVAVAAYPDPVSYEDMEAQTGITRAGGTWRTYLAELRGLQLVTGKGDIRANDDLFA